MLRFRGPLEVGGADGAEKTDAAAVNVEQRRRPRRQRLTAGLRSIGGACRRPLASNHDPSNATDRCGHPQPSILK
jgi:hypothetical protein